MPSSLLSFKIFGSNKLNLVITNDCNMNCSYCFNRISCLKEYATYNMLFSTISTYYKKNALYKVSSAPVSNLVTFTGGEPTLHSDCIISLLNNKELNDLNLQYLLTTNGLIHQTVLKKLVKTKVKFFISYDGINSLRITANSHDIDNNILQTIKYVSNNNIDIILSVVISDINVNSLHKIVNFAHRYNIKNIVLQHLRTTGNADLCKLKQPAISDIIYNYLKTYEYGLKYNINVMHTALSYKTKQYIEPVILPDGYLVPNFDYISSKLNGVKSRIFGKYSIDKGFEIFNKKISHMQKNYENHINSFCLYCSCFEQCAGKNHNFGSIITNDKKFQLHNYECQINRAIHQFF